MLAGLPGTLLASVVSNKKGKPLPRVGEFFRFLDPITETPVVRLTSLQSNSFLPASTNSFISVKERFLIFSSDRGGTLAPFKLDLRNGLLTQLARPRKLEPKSLCLNQKRTALYLLDGDSLQEITLANHKLRVLTEGVSSFCELARDSGPDPKLLIVRQGRLETWPAGSAPLAENVESFCLTRPGDRGCFFQRNTTPEDREFWYTPLPASEAGSPVLLARGKVSNPVWMPNGQSLLFLRDVARSNGAVSEIHAINPETRSEQRVATTTQFAAFSPNGDASVFVGASRSKAQPTVLLLLAAVQREFTLCEHRASHPAAVSPVFSPDSKRVYFQTDHEGKSALYSVNVEALIEPTPGGDL